MKCSQCGAELSEGSHFCNICGAKVEPGSAEVYISESAKLIENDPANSKERKFIFRRIPAKSKIIIIIASFFVLISLVTIYCIYPEIKYNNAENLFNTYQYNQAISAFNELGNYKDSPEKIRLCKYELANISIKQINYENAIDYLSQLKNYKDSNTLLYKCYYQQAQSLAEKSKYEEAISLLHKTDNYLNSKELTQEYLIDYGMQIYNSGEGDLDKALNIFDQVDEDDQWKISTYKNKINTIKHFQGNWVQKEDNRFGMNILGTLVTDINPDGQNGEVFEPEDEKLVFGGTELYFDRKILVRKVPYASGNGYEITHYSLGEVQTVVALQEPRIGMTAEEVKQSSWGRPEKINRTITASTVHEQWVYSIDKYIYLDNGVVTAIQD